MTKEQFKQFEGEDMPCAFFHVMSDDIDEETGLPLEQIILDRMLKGNPGVLEYQPREYWEKMYIGTCYLADVKKANEEVLKQQNKNS